jgi:hypothetical protein
LAAAQAKQLIARLHALGFRGYLDDKGAFLIADATGHNRDLSRLMDIGDFFSKLVAGLEDKPDMLGHQGASQEVSGSRAVAWALIEDDRRVRMVREIEPFRGIVHRSLEMRRRRRVLFDVLLADWHAALQIATCSGRGAVGLAVPIVFGGDARLHFLRGDAAA